MVFTTKSVPNVHQDISYKTTTVSLVQFIQSTTQFQKNANVLKDIW